MLYRLLPYTDSINLQKGYKAWRLLKKLNMGIWDAVYTNKYLHILDLNERNKLAGMPPYYYIVDDKSDVMTNIEVYFKNIKVIDKSIGQITFEAD